MKASPVVLVRTPYGRDFEVPTPLLEPRTLTGDGFAVVVQDVRGRGDSNGVFDPFRQEAPDGRATIEWVANQGWCTGQVVMAGSSYCGALQWLAAGADPTGLCAISPAFTATSFDEGWMRRGGALELGFVGSWVAGILGPPESLWLDDVQRAYREPEALAEVAVWSRPWVDEATSADYWAALAVDPATVNIPSLSIGGWYDIFIDGTLRAWTANRNPRSRLVIGPWAHDETLSHVVGSGNLGSAGSGARAHLPDRMVDFFNAAIGDRDPQGPAVLAYALGERQWLELPAWPPPGAHSAKFEVPAGRFLHDRVSPPPSLGGRCLRVGTETGLGYGVEDQSPLTARRDVFKAVVEPATSPALLAGPVKAHLRVASEHTEVNDWVCILCIERPDGRLTNLCEGIRRVVGPTEIVTVDMGDVCVRLDPHESLVLLIAGASFPRWDSRGGSGWRQIMPHSTLELTLV